ncbi:MAG: ATP-binding protein [Chloroflexi bacterium]|nr:ATP-binding protein [Chloroflexota bacterium]
MSLQYLVARGMRLKKGSNGGDTLDGRDVETLRERLRGEFEKVSPVDNGKGFLVGLCGLPGTGKSHFAAALARRVPCLVLGSDRLRKILVSRPVYSRDEHQRVFDAAHALLEELLAQGYRVIFDATNLTERARNPLYEIAARTGTHLILVQFDAPPHVVRRRLARRSQGRASDSYSDADWRIYCRLFPGQEPVEGPHYSVDSSRSIEGALDAVAGLLK